MKKDIQSMSENTPLLEMSNIHKSYPGSMDNAIVFLVKGRGGRMLAIGKDFYVCLMK